MFKKGDVLAFVGEDGCMLMIDNSPGALMVLPGDRVVFLGVIVESLPDRCIVKYDFTLKRTKRTKTKMIVLHQGVICKSLNYNDPKRHIFDKWKKLE